MATIRHRHLRPRSATAVDDRLKLHRHALRLSGRPYSILTLRPGTAARFATNRYHDTWHILSDAHGARLLARLLWGLAFQRRPGTVVLIDPRFLDRNPFDAAPSDPVALFNPDLTGLRPDAARELRRRFAGVVPAPAGSVRWRTFGFAAAMAARRAERERSFSEQRPPYIEPPPQKIRIERTGGVIVCAARPETLRTWSLGVADLSRWWYYGQSDLGLDRCCQGEGEVQIFQRYRRKVTAARMARAEVLAATGAEAGTAARLTPAQLDERIWVRGAAILRRYRRPG